jgi:hypothetical protein
VRRGSVHPVVAIRVPRGEWLRNSRLMVNRHRSASNEGASRTFDRGRPNPFVLFQLQVDMLPIIMSMWGGDWRDICPTTQSPTARCEGVFSCSGLSEFEARRAKAAIL